MSIKSLLKSELNGWSLREQEELSAHDYLIKRLHASDTLNVHQGCVNTLSWSRDGELLLSGSDDRHLCLTNAFSGKHMCSLKTLHRGNILSAKFMSNVANNSQIISSSSTGEIFLYDVNEPLRHTNRFACHGDRTCYELRCVPYETSQFVSCGQDGTIKWFDLRIKSKCAKELCDVDTLVRLASGCGISNVCLNPSIPYHLVCGCQDGCVRFYDRRMLSVGTQLLSSSDHALFALFGSPKKCNLNNRKRITSLQYNETGDELLVSYQPDKIFLLDWRQMSTQNDEENRKFLRRDEHVLSGETNFLNKKFRIQTDWSDTGPESLRLNGTHVMEGVTRNPIIRRLNDWFQEIYRQRRLSTNEDVVVESNDNDDDDNDDDEMKISLSEFDINEDERKKSQMLNSFIRFRDKAREISKRNSIEFASPKITQAYSGHRNSRTFIKECNFWGDKYIMSGSDCGHVFFWNKHTAKLVHIIEADKHVVNCVQRNPLYPILATSGIDYDIKIWQSTLEETPYLDEKLEKVSKRNNELINESRDTIFVPVQFMLPALRLFTGNRGSR